ncbi:MAG: hypothetical protein AAF564_01360 [Bacteroidota bacterium]
MGKVSIIAALVFSLIGFILLGNMQQATRETSEAQSDYHTGQLARELAVKGRKLIIAEWINLGGVTGTEPFTTISENGGTISVESYGADPTNANVLDFTVRGIYEGAVHEIRTRYSWNNFTVNPLQITAPDMTTTIDPNANLDFPSITLDDQSLHELDEVLIDELQLANDLDHFNLGLSTLVADLENEIDISGHANTLGVSTVTETDRSSLNQQNGLFFPSQVEQAINNFLVAHPTAETVINGSSIPSQFGSGTDRVLRIDGNANFGADFAGEGVLIVEGNFEVPSGVNFTWDGIILVKPKETNLNPNIDLSGIVSINGGLVIIQEGIPNTGHMDLTINYDADASWGNQYGDQYPWWRHTHDFSGRLNTTQVGFESNINGFTVHGQTKFGSLQNALNSPTNDSLFLEILNPGSHGRAILTTDFTGFGPISYPLAAGFDPQIADLNNQYRSHIFHEGDLQHMDIAVTRISSLKKLWDTAEGYPGCNDSRYWDGPRCVGTDYNRFGALALRLYQIVDGAEKHLYDASLYWHRRQDEEEEFEEEMNDLISDIQSTDYGVNLNIGSDVTISINNNATAMLSGMGNLPFGMTNLGTWHRHWEPGEAGNPLHTKVQGAD